MNLQHLPKRIRLWMCPSSKVRWLTILSLSVVVGTLGFGGAILFDVRNDAREQAERSSDNLVTALACDIARIIKLYDLSVQGAIDAWDRADLQQISPETRRMALFDRAASADYLESLAIVDASGTVVASSIGNLGLQLSLADRDYFRIQQERVDAGLYVSRPFSSRLRSGDLSIAISRRIFGHDGRFGGIVVGMVKLTSFLHLFENVALGSQGTVTLFRTDGRLIMRSPFKETDIDGDYSHAAISRQSLASRSGHLVATSAIDGVERLFTYRQIDDLPLILSVGISIADMYEQWWRKAIPLGVALSALCGTAMVLLVMFRGEIRHRIAAEQRLAIVASTDGLTGIVNRCFFDQTLTQEWRRAIRLETPMALLKLNADFLKVFNDTYGHSAGDRVLRAIADCIVGNICRPGDIAGRHAGEEFIALLSDTEVAGALKVAENIRAAVAKLNIPHAGSPIERITVSIGVAVAYPAHIESEAFLVKEADEALYEAKRTGFNQVCIGVRTEAQQIAESSHRVWPAAHRPR